MSLLGAGQTLGVVRNSGFTGHRTSGIQNLTSFAGFNSLLFVLLEQQQANAPISLNLIIYHPKTSKSGLRTPVNHLWPPTPHTQTRVSTHAVYWPQCLPRSAHQTETHHIIPTTITQTTACKHIGRLVVLTGKPVILRSKARFYGRQLWWQVAGKRKSKYELSAGTLNRQRCACRSDTAGTGKGCIT